MWIGLFGDFLPHLPISLCLAQAASVLLHILQSSLLTPDTITPLSPPSPCQQASFRDWCLSYLQAQLPAGAAAVPTSLLPRRTTSLSEWGRTTLFTHDLLVAQSWTHQVSLAETLPWVSSQWQTCETTQVELLEVYRSGCSMRQGERWNPFWLFSIPIQWCLRGLHYSAMGSPLPDWVWIEERVQAFFCQRQNVLIGLDPARLVTQSHPASLRKSASVAFVCAGPTILSTASLNGLRGHLFFPAEKLVKSSQLVCCSSCLVL